MAASVPFSCVRSCGTNRSWGQSAAHVTLRSKNQKQLRSLHATQPGEAGAGEPGAADPTSVADYAEQLMKDPETAARLQRVTDAAQRVAELQAESARLAQAMAEAEAASAVSAEVAERRGQAAAAEIMAAAEVAAAEKL